MEENKDYMDIIDDSDADRFCFDGKMEFFIYAKHAKDIGRKKNIIWVNKSTYNDRFMQGYHLYEDRKYEKALQAYKKALEVNPVGINARFEICECYLKLGNLIGARTTLLEMQDFLVENKHIAKFYRRLGFIAIEQQDYRLAAACFVHSLKHEKSNLVIDELLYIHSATGGIEPIGDPEKVMRSAKIPILTRYSATSMKETSN